MSDIKITKERIDALLSEADIRTLTLFGKCTVVTAKLKNGFVLTADSACVDPANYDKRTGERICLEHIANKLWELEGYRRSGTSSTRRTAKAQRRAWTTKHSMRCARSATGRCGPGARRAERRGGRGTF